GVVPVDRIALRLAIAVPDLLDGRHGGRGPVLAVDTLIIDGGPLTPDRVVSVAHRKARAVPSPDLAERLAPAREVVERAVDSGEIVYGITTGVGALANTNIGRSETEALQVNLRPEEHT